MKFIDFSNYLLKIEHISSRLEITYLLAELYLKLAPEERQSATYLLQGQLVPDYESLEFQLSEKMLLRALSHFVKVEATADLFGEHDSAGAVITVTALYKKLGDIGTIAEKLLGDQAGTGLEIDQVYEQLRALALAHGTGSQEVKLQLVVHLLQQLDAVSAKYVIRIIMGKMRLGFSKMTLLDALSWAMTQTKNERVLLEDAYQKRADVGNLAAVYLSQPDAEKRQAQLTNMTVEWGVPVVPALCQRLNTAQEVIEKMETIFVEPKYDGMRLQIHIRKATETEPVELKLFTRNLENVGHMFPEFTALAAQLQGIDQAIFDAEVIAYDPATGGLRPFQETITRRRKHDVTEQAQSVPVRVFIFDLLLAGHESLIDKKLQERKESLKEHLLENEQFISTKHIATSDPKEIQDFHGQQLGAGLEGVVMKQVDGVYQSGRKGWNWVKMKEAEGTMGKLSDTLDVVVLGYYRGKGKRTGFGVGAFLVGIRDDTGNDEGVSTNLGSVSTSDVLKTVSKIGTGLSDEQFAELKTKADALTTPQNEQPSNYDVPKELFPDVWLQPGLVVEIAADEITQSPLHSAGLALRFPRLVKFRDDKSWQDATTLSELRAITIS